MFDLSFSWIAVIAASLVSGCIGWLWYSPRVFGEAWADSLGFSLDQLKMQPLDLVKEFASALIKAIVLAELMNWTGQNSIWNGLVLGFWCSVGFIATAQYSAVIWARLPLKTYFINSGASIVSLTLMGGVIGLFA